DRILLCECQSSECEAELEVTPSPMETAGRRAWYALAPDLDVYPHILSEGQRLRAASAAYGAEWEPTALEVREALEAVRPGCLALQGGEKPSRRIKGKASWRSTPAAAAATSPAEELYPGLLVGSGPLPANDGLSWHVVAGENPTELRQAVRHQDFGKVGIATRGADSMPAKAADPSSPGPELETDARVLDIKTRPDSSRHRHFTEAARLASTTEWAEWPIMGPRTAGPHPRQDQHPRARHTKWVHACRLEATDEGVRDHHLAMRMAELGLSFDRLNLGELASCELLMRKAQMAEWRHRDRLAAVQGGDLMEESYLHLGTGETRGLAMVAPRWAELQKKIQQQAAELRKIQEKGAGKDQAAGRGAAGQQRSLDFTQSIVEQAGPPPCSPAAAHQELCGHQPGYATEPEQPAQYQREILSLPGPGARCDPSDVLRGLEHDQWVHWERHLLRRTPAPDKEIKLHNDRNLMADRRRYAQFILGLHTSGLVRVGAKRSATVGVFCAWKSGRERLRLIFDKRRVNARFHDPDHSQLPSAAAWAALRTNPSSSLSMAQADVDNAFYRVKLPDKMDEHFSSPSVHLSSLRQLAEGLLETTVLRSGIDAGPLIMDRHAPLQVRTSSTQPGVYVDNVCIVGGDGDRRVADCTKVVSELERVGLKCKGAMEPEDLQTFTGITFERRSGRVGISPGRMWKIRLAPLFVADRRSATGAYVLARVAGHRRLRLWSRVELELRQAAALLVFAFSDSKRPNSPFAYASDASRGQSGSGGGHGVVGQTWADELVERTASSAEAWRYSVLDAIGARERALGFDPVEGTKVGRRQARAGSTSFEGVARSSIGDFNDWGVLFHGEFQRDEDIAVLEGRAAGRTARSARALRAAPLPLCRGFGRGAAGLGDALHDDPYPLGGLAGLLGGALRLAWAKARRSAHRGADERAQAEGLTVLQSLKVGNASRVYFEKEYLDFLTRARSRGLSILGLASIDSTFSQYLDFPFWEGYNHHKGDKAFAALKHFNPGLGLTAAALERTAAGLRGFRKLARGSTRAPMARELLFAAAGVALHRGWRNFAIALAPSWDTMVRLPSEIVQMTLATLVAPAPRSGRAAWSLLLFPEEYHQVSKTLGCDEGVAPSDSMSVALGVDLARLKRGRPDGKPLWDFDARVFNAKFRTVFDKLGHKDCHPYQVRHGGASYRAAVLGEKLADIQAMLRHQSDNSTKRYARHVRYFAEVGKLSPEVARDIDARLGDLLRGGAAEVLTDAAVRRHWRAALRAALSGSRRHQVYLDLFSGTGKVASWLERKSDYAVLRIDVAAHPAFDLSRRVCGAIVIGWLRSRVVR
ncbi:unnamed protein product, partial [Prorocentrum cordatum]